MKFLRKNFNDLYLVEIEHKFIHIDCFLITAICGIIFSLIIGPYLEPYEPTRDVLSLIAFIFSLSSLFWAWRIAAYLRKRAKNKVIKWQIRKSFKDGMK